MENNALETLLTLNTNIPPSKDIPIEDDDNFDYFHSQVARGEFFAHTYEPSFTFNKLKISINTACIKKLPNVEYVQILVNQEKKMLIVKPCLEEERDSFKWCTSKRTPRQVTCKIFYAKIMHLMEWDPNNRYKILGKLIRSNGQLFFVFDLKNTETFIKITSREGKEVTSRTPIYPAEWQNQFGIPFSEHQMNLKVNIVDGYATYEIEESDNKAQKASDERKSNEQFQ